MRILYTICLLAIISIARLSAQDTEGCKDHPFFTRLPNFYITECLENFNSIDVQTGGNEKVQKIEGNVTHIVYGFSDESGAKKPSPLQIVKNYENAILKNHGKKLYSGADNIDGGELTGTFIMSKDGKDYWVVVRKFYEPLQHGEVGAFDLYVIEKEPMKQDIAASEMFEGLTSTGSVALYINFETGKAQIKPESENIIDQIVEMLKSNPTLKISLEGHTDNVGKAEANKSLSLNRATAVINDLVGKGIDKSRLSAKGWGQEKPISGNDTDEDRAKNRRVEIVKQ